ncbi:MAG TPA: C39 family peptidase [Anaerolineae bacterium]|nr:C39 family peptidase [Anaerolineae bacterium]HOQ99257.1 C39 family peptidase [Anaerolineae bacterium]HPL30601.1 C39 family peptidase [Anaerolineae bacterium]
MLTRPLLAARLRAAGLAGAAFLALAASACGPSRPTAAPTARAIAATQTPAPTATPSATATPTATRTATATRTPTATATPTPPAERELLLPMSHEYQGWNNCGVVSAGMVLSYYGIERGQYEIAAAVRPYKDDKHVGSDELLDYFRSQGLEGRLLVNGSVARLHELVAAGVPVIVRTILEPGDDIGHYVVIRGYDSAAHTLIANDSYFGPEHVIPEAHFAKIWAPFNHSYIPVYRPAQAGEVRHILGEDDDEKAMYRRAGQAAQSWTREAPDDPYAWLNLGDNLLALGEPVAALEAYDKAVAIGLPPRTFWYRFGPFEARLAARHYRELLTTSQVVLDKMPCIEELRLLRGQAHEALGEEEQAIEEYLLAFEYHTNWAPAVAALTRLGAALPATPTPTPLGTPNVPPTRTPTPSPTGATPAEDTATPSATSAAPAEGTATPTAP